MNPNQEFIKVATDFSRTPGARHPSEGKFSGHAFRTDHLYPKLLKAIRDKFTLIVDLDGTSGFGTSFLEEAFGGLIRENGVSMQEIKESLQFVSDEEPSLKEEIMHYIKEAELERNKNA